MEVGALSQRGREFVAEFPADDGEADRAGAAPGLAASPLRNCSSGSRRCACTSFSKPNSRWKRCSCLYPRSEWVRSMICRKRVRSSSLKRSATRETRARSSEEICSTGESLPATLATTVLRRKRTICRAKCCALCPSTSRRSMVRSTSSLELRRDGVHHVFEDVGTDRADQSAHHIGAERVAATGDGLIHDAEGVAHGAVAGFGQHGERVVVGGYALLLGDVAQLADDVVKADGVKAEVLAARADGLRNVFRLRGRHHENHVRGRLFQRLQQRVKGGIGNLVGFVEDPDLVAVARRTVTGGIAQFADFVDAAIGGGVDLDHVNRVALADFDAGVAHAARLGDGMIVRTAVQRHGQNARDGGFADAAVSAEDVAMCNALLLDGIFQGAGDVLLPDDVGEFLRSIFAGQNLVTHGRKIRLYVLRLWKCGTASR